jgi:DNA mismatch repair protein PMS2
MFTSSSVLDLTAAEEHTVMDNIDIFKANGFDVEILSDNEPTKRIRVISQPVSKNTMFDRRDFSEIIHLINEHPGEMVRCSRIRAMFASRACHKAARIGDSLTKRQMTKVSHLFLSLY